MSVKTTLKGESLNIRNLSGEKGRRRVKTRKDIETISHLGWSNGRKEMAITLVAADTWAIEVVVHCARSLWTAQMKSRYPLFGKED